MAVKWTSFLTPTESSSRSLERTDWLSSKNLGAEVPKMESSPVRRHPNACYAFSVNSLKKGDSFMIFLHADVNKSEVLDFDKTSVILLFKKTITMLIFALESSSESYIWPSGVLVLTLERTYSVRPSSHWIGRSAFALYTTSFSSRFLTFMSTYWQNNTVRFAGRPTCPLQFFEIMLGADNRRNIIYWQTCQNHNNDGTPICSYGALSSRYCLGIHTTHVSTNCITDLLGHWKPYR